MFLFLQRRKGREAYPSPVLSSSPLGLLSYQGMTGKENAVTRRSTLLSLNSTSPLRFFHLCICRSQRPGRGLKATCALHVVSPSFVCHFFFLYRALSIWKIKWSLQRKHARPSTVHTTWRDFRPRSTQHGGRKSAAQNNRDRRTRLSHVQGWQCALNFTL